MAPGTWGQSLLDLFLRREASVWVLVKEAGGGGILFPFTEEEQGLQGLRPCPKLDGSKS